MPKNIKSFFTDELTNIMGKLKIEPSVYTVKNPSYYIGTQKELLTKKHCMDLCEGDWLIYDYHGIKQDTPHWCLFAINRTFTIIDSEMTYVRTSKSDTNYGFLSENSLSKIIDNMKSPIDLAQGSELFE